MNEYTLKDSFEFAKDINNQNSNFFMDLETYFYVPLDEMFEMLSLSLKESFILFDNKYYSQIDGIPCVLLCDWHWRIFFFVIMKVIG